MLLAVQDKCLAFLLGIAPNIVTVLPIMVGNVCYVLVLCAFLGKSLKPFWKQPAALVAASALKFGVLYLLVVELICGFAADALLGKKIGQTVILAQPMLKMLPTMFTWPQLFTALIGGAAALAVAPVLRKVIKK